MGNERYAQYRQEFQRNKKKILATQDVCGICGHPVDKSLPYPHPMSPTIDHIVPIALGGHPADIDNLQLAHFTCNRQKSDKVQGINTDKGVVPTSGKAEVISNRNLPHAIQWERYRAKGAI